MRLNLIFALIFVAGAAAGLILGVFAGRHNLPPVPTIISLKAAFERVIAPSFHWRRPFFENTQNHEAIPCPNDSYVIVTGGQSNSANHLSDPIDARPDLPAFMFFRGHCYPLQDPLLGATGDRGSLWTQLGHRLALETGRSVVFINGGVTSSTYRDWTMHPTGYFERLQFAVKEAASVGLSVNLVIWHQGESDANRTADVATLQAEIDSLLRRVRADLTLGSFRPILLFETSVCSGGKRRHPNGSLREAQRLAAESNRGVSIAMDTDELGMRERYDDCHFNARGRAVIVDRLAELILPLVKEADSTP